MSGEKKAMESSTASVREAVRDALERKEMSFAALAGAVGLGKTMVSLWLNDKYTGDNEKIETAFSSWLDREQQKMEAPFTGIPVVETDVLRRINELALYCHTDGEISVAYGEAGVGKTTAAKQYTKDNPGTILIEADMGYTAKTVFTVMAEELGIQTKGSIHDLFEGCRKRLSGSGRVVIVDEAEHLPYRALELLRRLHDKAEIGVLLIGMPRLLANLRGNRGEYAQLYSRVSTAMKMNTLNIDDVIRISVTVPEFSGLHESVYAELLAVSEGNARRLSKLLRNVRKMARVNGTEICDSLVRSAASVLM